jgi:DNA polymerase-1
MNYMYIDFEYIESKDRTSRSLICAVIEWHNGITQETMLFELLTPNGQGILKTFLNMVHLESTIFVGYSISGAEVPCMVQIMGEDWVKKTQWIDVWVEFKMWTLTHADFYEFKDKSSLSECINCFDIKDQYKAEKEEVRDLILYDEANRKCKALTRLEANTFRFSHIEIEKILKYCAEDVAILPKIVKKIGALSKYYSIEITLQERLKRGEFCMLSGISYENGLGFPMDIERTKAVFENRDKIKKMIQLECNNKTGFEIYRPIYRGRGENKIIVGYSFTHSVFEQYVEAAGLLNAWEKTEKGTHLRLDEEYLDHMLSSNKEILTPLYNARNTLKQLTSTNLADIMSPQGYIKCPPFPFHQKTSRSSPKPKLGFILNLSPWLRMLIKPPKGRAFVGIDFKSQEILIAACLAKEPLMLQGYLKDFYMDTAINTGFAPPEATKKTHAEIRNAFKPIALAILYGQQAKSLSYKFQHLEKDTQYEDAFENAKLFIENHKEAYARYWGFVEDTYQSSIERGYYRGPGESGWYYFVDSNTRTSQLQNVPCQKGGAEMMRMSHNPCVKDSIYVITLHDALYFECAEEDAIRLAKIVSKHMCEASHRLLGHDYMSTETTIFTHDMPYYDSRGEETYRLVMNELGFEVPQKFSKPPEIPNIHLQD